MLTRLSEFVVHVADLAEAEGRDLRRAVGRLGTGFSFSLVAGGLFLVAAGLLLAGLWLAIAQVLNASWSSVLTGVAALGLGVASLKIAEKYHL